MGGALVERSNLCSTLTELLLAEGNDPVFVGSLQEVCLNFDLEVELGHGLHLSAELVFRWPRWERWMIKVHDAGLPW